MNLGLLSHFSCCHTSLHSELKVASVPELIVTFHKFHKLLKKVYKYDNASMGYVLFCDVLTYSWK